MERKMRWALGPMTGPEARQVTEWQYPAPYEMYNWAEEDDPAELLDGSYLACREESGALGGFLCFGPNATIPTKFCHHRFQPNHHHKLKVQTLFSDLGSSA